MEQKFFVIAMVGGVTYLTKVLAKSTGGAEHKILDLGYCGKHEYGVEGCTAYDSALMKTDCFRYEALEAEPINLQHLIRIIEARNNWIRQKDAAEIRVQNLEKEIRELTEKLELLKAEHDEALEFLNN